MTGHAPLLPKWAYGFFQSKDRYVSLGEIREIADRYRQDHIPLDAMVQDWFWWKTEGDPVFNSNYHDVAQDLDALHKENVHAMISVWGLLSERRLVMNQGKILAYADGSSGRMWRFSVSRAIPEPRSHALKLKASKSPRHARSRRSPMTFEF